jgi:hypothetical protein
MKHWLDSVSFGPNDDVFEPDDDAVRLSDRSTLTTAMNLRLTVNAHAPYAPGLSMSMPDTGGAIIDCCFGRVYTELPAAGSAVYGTTGVVFPGVLDTFADPTLGHLRVPFKRIPRIVAQRFEDIDAVVRRAAEVHGRDKLLFRGQCAEYTLNRSAAFRDRFYGDPDALEPSLLPSAGRRPHSVERCMSEFMMHVQLWQQLSINRLAERTWRHQSQAALFASMAGSVEDAWRQPRFYYQALALAQHYGLASVGLDVSSSVRVALFFALRDCLRGAGNRASYVPVSKASRPVLYIIVAEGTREYAYHASAPDMFHGFRPAKQDAWFMHVGWGLSRNAVADQIVAAIYLDPSRDYGVVPDASMLFPSPDEDPLGRFLESLGDHASDALAGALSDFYWVEQARE